MATTVTMPQLGESVVEGTIAKWLVREGEAVQEDQALVEVTTDKIDTEIPSPAAGVIGSIRVPEGQTVAVGTVLCEIVPAVSVSKSLAGVRSFDKSGNIGENNFTIMEKSDAEIWIKRRKRIIGNSRARIRYRRNKSRFARIRQTK